MLKPKRMQDSYVELYLPFTEDPELLEKYIATSGLIRLGKVLEDLDSLAGGSESPSRSASSLRMRHVLTLILSFPSIDTPVSYQHALGGRPGEYPRPSTFDRLGGSTRPPGAAHRRCQLPSERPRDLRRLEQHGGLREHRAAHTAHAAQQDLPYGSLHHGRAQRPHAPQPTHRAAHTRDRRARRRCLRWARATRIASAPRPLRRSKRCRRARGGLPAPQPVHPRSACRHVCQHRRTARSHAQG